jgi:pimeloyl-ACP methyl ester carboxylesterase
MKQLRKYGRHPYSVAVIHGGPGAPGEMAPVAREMSSTYGILEPLQTRDTLQGQVEELQAVLMEHGNPPLVLIGHSWGAVLSFIVAADNPSLVSKLILVGSAVFEEEYAPGIMETRLSRLSPEDRATVARLTAELQDPAAKEKDGIFAQLGTLIARADSYDPITDTKNEIIEYQYHIYQEVWRAAEGTRSSGALLNMGQWVECPVVAIHGDYDAHPAEGVRIPLSRALRDFRFLLLERCGHYPWREKRARDTFYATLRNELQP